MLKILAVLFAARQRGVEYGAAPPTQKDQGSFEFSGGYPPFRLPKTRQRAEIRQVLSYKTHRPFPTNAGAMGRYSGFVQSGP